VKIERGNIMTERIGGQKVVEHPESSEMLECRPGDVASRGPSHSPPIQKTQKALESSKREFKQSADSVSRLEQTVTPMFSNLRAGESNEIELSLLVKLIPDCPDLGAKGRVKVTKEEDGSLTVELLAEFEASGSVKKETDNDLSDAQKMSQGFAEAKAKVAVALSPGLKFNLKSPEQAADLIDSIVSCGVVVTAGAGIQETLARLKLLDPHGAIESFTKLMHYLENDMTNVSLEYGGSVNLAADVQALCFKLDATLELSGKVKAELDVKNGLIVVSGTLSAAGSGAGKVGIEAALNGAVETSVRIEIPIKDINLSKLDANAIRQLLAKPDLKMLQVSKKQGSFELGKNDIGQLGVKGLRKETDVSTFDLKENKDLGTIHTSSIELETKNSQTLDLEVIEAGFVQKRTITFEGKTYEEAKGKLSNEMGLQYLLSHSRLRQALPAEAFPKLRKS
jgi:hypothetical protein